MNNGILISENYTCKHEISQIVIALLSSNMPTH
jgi:hypothetical protein